MRVLIYNLLLQLLFKNKIACILTFAHKFPYLIFILSRILFKSYVMFKTHFVVYIKYDFDMRVMRCKIIVYKIKLSLDGFLKGSYQILKAVKF